MFSILDFNGEIMVYFLTRHFNFLVFTKLSEAYGIKRKGGLKAPFFKYEP